MQKRVLVLFAIAGLFVFAFAGPRAGSPVPGNSPAQRRQFMDSLRTLTPKARHAAMKQWIRAGRAARQVRNGQNPGAPRKLGTYTNPFETSPIMPTPGEPSGGYSNQHYAAAAFDGSNYLVVWADDREGGDDYYIYGALVPTTGNPNASEEGFKISTTDYDYDPYWLIPPSVAFGAGNYLVVWQDYDDAAIYGRFVDTEGHVLGGEDDIEICTYAGNGWYKVDPVVVFDGTNFVVVWSDDQLDLYQHLYGALVDPSTGQVTPDNKEGLFIWGPEGSNQYAPSLAFDGTNCLVVWQDDRSTDYGDIFGALVSKALVVQVPYEFTIATTDGYDFWPRVAFDGTNYLVVWEADYADVNGIRVKTNGDLLTPVISMCTGATAEPLPDVVFNGSDYFVVWQDEGESDLNIYGCRVTLDGGADAFDNPIADGGYEEGFPAIAAGPVEGTAMVAYEGVPSGYDSKYRILARRATLPLDGNVGTTSIVRPVASYIYTDECWPIPPVARVYNYGTETRSFKAKFTVTPPLEDGYTSTKTVLGVRPHTSRSVEFDPYPLEVGLFTPKCSTMLTGEIEETRGDDAVAASFQGCDTIFFSDVTDGGLVPVPDTCWTCDVPESPWTLPPMDSKVWGERLSGYYGDDEDAYLTSPLYEALDNSPSIAFQHSFRTEASSDGGNLSWKLSTGSQWTVLAPSAGLGYGGVVAALKEGEVDKEGWSGNSSGWKQSVFTFDDVVDGEYFQVRWHFASDGTNSSYNGWLIDEVACINCDVSGLDRPRQGLGSLIDTLSVTPNPVRGDGQLSYTLLRDCNVSIKLYDASGRLAARPPTSGFKKGVNTAKMDVTKLQRGVYFLTVAGAGDVSSTKVIIQ